MKNEFEELRKRLANPPEEDLGELINEVENLKTIAEFEMNMAKNIRMYYINEYKLKKDLYIRYNDMLYELKEIGKVVFTR